MQNMDDIAHKILSRLPPSPAAFITYHPKTGATKEQVSYNTEAWKILIPSASSVKKKTDPPPDFSSLCARWKGLLDERLVKSAGSSEEPQPVSDYIDLYQSRRRRYGIRGFVMSNQPATSKNQRPIGHYLFILERIIPEGVNLAAMFRQWNLNRREQELVRLLLVDRSNKEMADILGLSLNTVKGYLKLLMRRLGVSSRTGIVTCLLTGRNPFSRPPTRILS